MSFPAKTEPDALFAVEPAQLRLTRATDDGTPGGVFLITGDYSVSPQTFYIEAPPGEVWVMSRLDIYIQGSGNITANGYGPMSALPNGLLIRILDPVGVSVTAELLARSTGEWKSIPGSVLAKEEAGARDNFLNVEISFGGTSGSPVLLRPGYRIEVTAQDDFTPLTQHFASISGFSLDTV